MDEKKEMLKFMFTQTLEIEKVKNLRHHSKNDNQVFSKFKVSKIIKLIERLYIKAKIKSLRFKRLTRKIKKKIRGRRRALILYKSKIEYYKTLNM